MIRSWDMEPPTIWREIPLLRNEANFSLPLRFHDPSSFVCRMMRFIMFVFHFWPNFRWVHKKLVYRLINCSPPRKSLVKGERFMRELKGNQSAGPFSGSSYYSVLWWILLARNRAIWWLRPLTKSGIKERAARACSPGLLLPLTGFTKLSQQSLVVVWYFTRNHFSILGIRSCNTH